jgi:hypothetical protein
VSRSGDALQPVVGRTSDGRLKPAIDDYTSESQLRDVDHVVSSMKLRAERADGAERRRLATSLSQPEIF